MAWYALSGGLGMKDNFRGSGAKIVFGAILYSPGIGRHIIKLFKVIFHKTLKN